MIVERKKWFLVVWEKQETGELAQRVAGYLLHMPFVLSSSLSFQRAKRLCSMRQGKAMPNTTHTRTHPIHSIHRHLPSLLCIHAMSFCTNGLTSFFHNHRLVYLLPDGQSRFVRLGKSALLANKHCGSKGVHLCDLLDICGPLAVRPSRQQFCRVNNNNKIIKIIIKKSSYVRFTSIPRHEAQVPVVFFCLICLH